MLISKIITIIIKREGLHNTEVATPCEIISIRRSNSVMLMPKRIIFPSSFPRLLPISLSKGEQKDPERGKKEKKRKGKIKP